MKRRQNYYLSYMPLVGQPQRGSLPDYDKALSRPINLDAGQLTPSLTLVQSHNCHTIQRLQSALQYMRRQQNPYTYPRGEKK